MSNSPSESLQDSPGGILYIIPPKHFHSPSLPVCLNSRPSKLAASGFGTDALAARRHVQLLWTRQMAQLALGVAAHSANPHVPRPRRMDLTGRGSWGRGPGRPEGWRLDAKDGDNMLGQRGGLAPPVTCGLVFSGWGGVGGWGQFHPGYDSRTSSTYFIGPPGSL